MQHGLLAIKIIGGCGGKMFGERRRHARQPVGLGQITGGAGLPRHLLHPVDGKAREEVVGHVPVPRRQRLGQFVDRFTVVEIAAFEDVDKGFGDVDAAIVSQQQGPRDTAFAKPDNRVSLAWCRSEVRQRPVQIRR